MNHQKAILYGIAIWLFAFLISLLIFPLRASERAFFESIMPVSLALATTIGAVRYLQHSRKQTAWVGFCLGLIWLGVSVGIDATLFSWGPMKMSLLEYIKDIMVTYLMIPVITTGLGYLAGKK